MPKADKKIFSVNGKEYTLVRGVRWYLEYYRDHRGAQVRVRTSGGLNRIKDLGERERAYMAHAAALASSGQCPLTLALDAARSMFKLKTYQSFCSRLRQFHKWLAGRPAASVDKAAGTAFISHLIGKGRKPATVKGYKVFLSTIYKRAGLLNPWPGVEVPKVVSRSLMYFSPSQASQVLGWLRVNRPDVALAAQLLYYCFIRPGEQRLLTLDCINLEQGTITIPAPISKNQKSGTVIIPAPLLTVLKESGCCAGIGSKLLFSRTGERLVGKNYFNRMHTTALKECGLSAGRYAFYSWKHTGAVMAVRAGINLKDLQLQLRHHSLDMVNEYLKDLGVMDSADLRDKFPPL